MMKIPPVSRQTLATCLSVLLLAVPSAVLSAAPDLTGPGVIATIDRSSTYNLGATGLRGWMYVNRANVGDVGLMTDESRQILVTAASTPATVDNALAVDDVILGATAAGSGGVPLFAGDARKAFGAAIGEAEKTGAGPLRVKRWRAGETVDVNIALTSLGNYAATAPFDCPKSLQILVNARNQIVGELLADPNYLANDYSGAIHGLALLASVPSGDLPGDLPVLDSNYTTARARLETYARSLASAGPVNNGLPIWDWSYTLLFLSEYYLLTGDPQVVSGINSFTLTLAQSQSIYGTYGHGPSVIRPDGSGRRVSTGYGPVNSVGVIANIALVMGKKALQAASHSIHPEIDSAIQRGSNFFAWYVNKGSIPYGEHEPVAANHASNGKDPAAAVFFGLQPDRTVETEYFTRMSIASWIGREYGHTGQGFSFLWAALGANMGGPDAAAEHLKNVRWHLDLARRSDGSFAYDGQEQYGGGSTNDGTYLGRSDHYGMNPTAIHLLTYSLPLKRLYITGKSANPAYTLDATKVANAVSAASFRLDRGSLSIAQLFAALGEYDPVVRNYASVELAARSLTTNDLSSLRNLLSSPDPNIRQSACQVLGIRQDANALPANPSSPPPHPTIVSLLNDPDPWVRAKAASAIRSYTSATASANRTAMINAFIANATDPDVIDWSDPIQTSNGKLSLALFGNAVPDGSPGNNIAAYTIGADKQTQLFPALRAGLSQPDSYPRTGVAQFCRTRLSLADAQALFPELVEAVSYDTPADRMWSGDSRAEGIRMFGNLKIAEGIPLALAMLEVPENFGWGSGTYLEAALNALASYGDAARYTLPTLKGHLNQWDPTSSQYTTLVSTIAAIENAITAPARFPGLCVANSQIVTTTGTRTITLTGASPRGPFTYINLTQPSHGTLTASAPNLTYTPNPGYTGPDEFTFQTTDTLTTSAVATVGIVVGASGNGLKGEYFNNPDFTGFATTRTDPQINFDWGSGTPDPSVGADTFSARWTGLLLAPETGLYTLSALTSDGVRVFVNGVRVIDRFANQSTLWTDGEPIYLSAGQMADVHVQYYENTGSAVAKLKWTGPSFAGENGSIIPQAYLFDGTGIADRPAFAFPQNLSTTRNTAAPVTLSGTGGTLAYIILTPPANGSLTGTPPNLTYTPAANFNGTDSVTFLVNNGSRNSAPATVSISIQAGALSSFNWQSALSGDWSVASNWTPAAPTITGQPNYALNFNPSGTYTATHNLNSGFQLNQLNTAAAVTIGGTQNLGFTANGGTLPQFNQNSSNAVTMGSPVTLAATTSFGGNGGGNVTITNLVTGPGGLVKNNPGKLQIHGVSPSNNFAGGTFINSGTLHLGAIIDGASPAVTNPLGSGPVTLNNGTIEFDRVTASNPLTVNGGTLFSNNGWGSTWTGPVTLNGTANVNCSYRFAISGSISGAGGLTKTGDDALILSIANSYTGPTQVTAGTLTCSHLSALGSGPLHITSPGKVNLAYTGTRAIAALTFDNGAPLPPGIYGAAAHGTYFSGSGTVTVLPPTSTSLTLSGGSSPANPGTPLTFTATVSGTSPSGNVAFYSGSNLLGTSPLNGARQAALTIGQLAIGPHNITARYLGNAGNAPGSSDVLAVEIIQAPVAAPAGLVATTAGGPINLSWSASAAASGYYVKRSFASGGPYTVLAYVTGLGFQDSTISPGATYHYVVTAINAAGESADSNQASVTIGIPVTTTTLASSPASTGTYGSPVTFTATVIPSGGPATGSVTFRNGSTVIGAGILGSGTATLAIATLAVANHSITATYDGDATYGSSVSEPSVYQVTPKPLTITGVTASDKIYDGNPIATMIGGAIAGAVVGGETVTLIPGSGTFASPNAGTWAVTATGYSLGGTHAGNYLLGAQPAVPAATITPRVIELSGTRPYDASTTATAGILTIQNNLDATNLTLTGSATLASKDVGTRGLIVHFATPARVQSKTGFSAANASTSFTVPLDAAPTNGNTLFAVVASRGIAANQVTGISSSGSTWTRVAQSVNSSGSTTEIWSAAVSSGAAAGVTISTAAGRCAGVVIEYSGILTASALDQMAASPGANSALPVTGTTPATTQTSELWIGGIGHRSSTPTLGEILNSFATVASAQSNASSAANNAKVYALERIVNSIGTASSGGTLSSPVLWSGAVATFKAAPSSTLALSGPAAGNYTLTGLTGSVEITPKALTLAATPAVTSKAYDTFTAATLTGATLQTAQAPGTGTTSDGMPYTGDAVALVLSGTFNTKDAGSDKAVTSTSTLSGANAGNYTLTQPIGVTGTITPVGLTITANHRTKTYGQTLAFGSGATQFTSIGLLDGETIESVTLTCAGGDAAAGVASYPITPSTATGVSYSATNYAIDYAAGTLTVDPAGQAITFGPLAAKTYGSGPFALTATADSLLPVTYLSSDSTVASISGNIVTLLKAGSTTITANQPGDTNYNTAAPVAQALTVDKAIPTITTPPTASDITDGQTLGTSMLNSGAGSTPGSFAFTAPATKPPVGTAAHSVTFTPADTVNYQNASTSVSVTVNAAMTAFETWAVDPAQGLSAGVNDDLLDDPDRDGFSNLMEFVLGGAPMVSSQVIQPRLTRAAGNWVFSYQRSHLSKSGTSQVVEYGDQLTSWTPLAIPAESAGAVTITPGASSDLVEVVIPAPGANGFVRLNVGQ